MVRAESLASLQRAVWLAARLCGGQALGARPAAAASHHALRTAFTALSADADCTSSLARHPKWVIERQRTQQQQLGWQTGARGFSAAHAAAATAPADGGLIVTQKAVQVWELLTHTSLVSVECD